MSEQAGSGLALFRDREFVALAGTAFARSQAYSTVLIALALYADAFGTTGFVEGLFGTAFALAQLFIVLPLGRAVDTGNAKKFLLAGLLFNVGVFAGFALVDSSTDVILVRIAQGVGASLLWITGSAVVGEISPEGGGGRWFGYYNQVGAFSSLFGDLVGGYLLYAYGFELTYAVLSAITLAVLGLVYRFLRDDPGGRTDPGEAAGVETFRALLRRPTVRALVAFRFLFSFGKMAVIVFLPVFARKEFGVSAFAIGAILAGGKLTKAVFQGWVGDLTDRLDNKHAFVAAGALVYAVGTAAIPLASVAADYVPSLTVAGLGRSLTVSAPVLTLFCAYGVLGVADSLRLPASMALFSREGEVHDSVASSMSLRSVSWKVGQVVGPVTVGLVKDQVSTAWAFRTAAAAVVVATVVFAVVYRRGDPVDAPTGVPGD